MALWRLYHRLLGWHYVDVAFGPAHRVCRVFLDGDGRPYVRIHGHHIDLRDTERKWYPLTFPRAAVAGDQGMADVVALSDRKRTK